jgi:hypothetical protein
VLVRIDRQIDVYSALGRVYHRHSGGAERIVQIVWFSRHKQAWIGERLVSAKSANTGVNIGLVDETAAIETRRNP